jgi:hypothetical protein
MSVGVCMGRVTGEGLMQRVKVRTSDGGQVVFVLLVLDTLCELITEGCSAQEY